MLPFVRMLDYGNEVKQQIVGTFTNTNVLNPLSSILDYGYCTDGEYLYMFGGRTGSGTATATNQFYRYNISTNTYDVLPSGSVPVRYSTGMAYGNGYIYVVSGWSSTGARLMDIWRYNISTQVWNNTGYVTDGGGSSGACYVNNILYTRVNQYVYKYNLGTNVRTLVATQGSANDSNRAIVTDGVDNLYWNYVGNILRYKISTSELTTLTSLQIQSLCYNNNKLYTIGTTGLYSLDLVNGTSFIKMSDTPYANNAISLLSLHTDSTSLYTLSDRTRVYRID